MNTNTGLPRRRRVLVTETREISPTTVRGLLETIQGVVREQRVEKLLYVRGEPLVVERYVPTPDVQDMADDDAFLTAFQAVRQHADLEIQPLHADPLSALARAVQSLTSRRYKLTMFICSSRDAVRSWLGNDLRIEDIWQVPLVEDFEATGGGVFVCGSASGSSMIRDIEAAVFCRMEE